MVRAAPALLSESSPKVVAAGVPEVVAVLVPVVLAVAVSAAGAWLGVAAVPVVGTGTVSPLELMPPSVLARGARPHPMV